MGTPPIIDYYTVDIQDTSLSVDFLVDSAWVGNWFNGLVVGQIDTTLTGVSVDTNLEGWNDANISFDAHTLYANWSGLPFTSTSYFDGT